MGYRHDRDGILDSAIAIAKAEGVSALSFGRLGKELGISDRTVVYYFPTKSELVRAVVVQLGAQLQGVLENAFGKAPLPADELMRRAWPALATAEADPVFALFFEVVGLACAKQPPHDELAPLLVEGWVDWLASRLKADTPAKRRRQALGVVARIDGLLLLRRISGARAANAAARELGILDG